MGVYLRRRSTVKKMEDEVARRLQLKMSLTW